LPETLKSSISHRFFHISACSGFGTFRRGLASENLWNEVQNPLTSINKSHPKTYLKKVPKSNDLWWIGASDALQTEPKIVGMSSEGHHRNGLGSKIAPRWLSDLIFNTFGIYFEGFGFHFGLNASLEWGLFCSQGGPGGFDIFQCSHGGSWGQQRGSHNS
jgi:hypothetical protein